MRHRRSIPPDVRFWNYVRLGCQNGCWLWTGATIESQNGFRYGVIHLGKRNGKRRTMMTHRFSYEMHKGPIPDGLSVLHRCDIPLCVNPDHLFIGTRADNNRDMWEKGRGIYGERHVEAKLTWRQVVEIRKQRGTATLSALGKKYGVSSSLIGAILCGRKWNPERTPEEYRNVA